LSQGRLPNLIIAGSVKSGTTSLFRYLLHHHQICGSNVKETCYFLPLRYGDDCAPLSEYRKHFSRCSDERYVIESTPGYFDGGRRVAEQIRRQLDDVRIVILMRNPADRLLSFFAYQKAQVNLAADLSFDEYLTDCAALSDESRRLQKNDPYWGIDGGRYLRYLPDWIDVFGRKNVYLMYFEQLVEDPAAELADLCEWLQLDGDEFDDLSFDVENRTVSYKFAALQKLAISTNRMIEPVVRRMPAVKKAIRSLYYAINAAPASLSNAENDRATANDIYVADNLDLAAYLDRQDYRDRPAWLQASGS